MVINELIYNRTDASDGKYKVRWCEILLEGLITVSGGLIDVETVYHAGLEVERIKGIGSSVYITSCTFETERVGEFELSADS